MTRFAIAFAVSVACGTLGAMPAAADFEERRSADDVATVMDRLEAAVRAAGATVFARIDHAAGAASVGMELEDAELLIFGNPRLGTLAMLDDIHAGIMLPIRILVYREDDHTVILWQEPEELFDDLRIDDDAPYFDQFEEVLEALTREAAGPEQ